ncbi:TPA: hypothetical protein QCK11_003894 [Enterobacter asburiae]|uniref:hypothetical protein n=1 Tax=Enterobacter soli TaxID=885040 RepID=UPI0032F5E804|nr:hypothetical protein [Enterobacter asburiae]HDR2800518.1 hypothetical protein [Enterobacter asburiae]HDR2863879.1 hypothetical protein [Enterobacter asburiae]
MLFESTEGDLTGLLHLIHLESELVLTVAYLRVFGSLHDDKVMTAIAGWAGYEYTLYGLEPQEWHSPGYADVASSVHAMAAYINQKDWQDGCQQAEFGLSQLE